MGDRRSIRKVAEKFGKSRAICERWSSTWGWTERAREYDNDIERYARKEAIKERKAMVERHIEIAVKMQGKALEALDGMDADRMNAKDIKEFIKIATELERMSRTLDDTKDVPDESEAEQIVFYIPEKY